MLNIIAMKKICLICVVLQFATCLLGQVPNVDSLVHVLNTQKLPVDEQLILLNEICVSYGKSNNYENVIVYGEKGLELALKEKNRSMAADFYESIGIANYCIGNYDVSGTSLKNAIDCAIQAGDSQKELSSRLSMGAYYGQLGKYVEALDCFIKALSLCESTGNKEQSIKVLGNMVSLYNTLNNFEKVAYYSEMIIGIADELHLPQGKIQAFYELGRYYNYKKDFHTALDYASKTVELSREHKYKIYEALGLTLMACTYNNLREYDMALEYINKSLPVGKETNNNVVMGSSWKYLSDIYRNQKCYKESEAAACKALELDSTDLATKSDLLFNIAYAKMYLGDLDNAATYFKEYNQAMLEKSNKNFHESLTDMEVKYETEKKEMRISTLEKERQLYIWLAIAGVFTILMSLGTLFFRHRLHVQKRKAVEQEREIAQQQIKQLEQEKQLIATQSILDGETAERSRLAHDLHDGLGGMLSVVKLNLEKKDSKAMKMLDESIVELRRIAHHMMPESLVHFGLKVSLEDFCRAIPNAHFQFIGKDSRLDPRLEVVLYRCAYELINNAVKYANASNIHVQLVIEEKLIALTVDDDGVGFDPDKVGSGTGLANIRTRVLAYNGKITIRSASGKGTEIIIEIESI